MLRLLLIALLALVPIGWAAPSFAQSAVPLVISACGTPLYPLTASQNANPTMDTTGKLCTTGSGGSVTFPTTSGTPCATATTAGCSIPDITALGPATSVVTSPTVTPTISTSAYTAGYLFALPMSFTVTNGGAIANASVTLNTGSYTGGIDLLLFNAALTGSYTANTALALTQTDMGKFIGVLHLSDCRASASAATVCQQLYQSQFYKLGGANTTIYGVPVIIAAGTFTNATDATFYLDQVQ